MRSIINFLLYRLRKKTFAKLSVDGSGWCIMELSMAFDEIQNSGQLNDYKVELVTMTQHQFEQLPEHIGF